MIHCNRLIKSTSETWVDPKICDRIGSGFMSMHDKFQVLKIREFAPIGKFRVSKKLGQNLELWNLELFTANTTPHKIMNIGFNITWINVLCVDSHLR